MTLFLKQFSSWSQLKSSTDIWCGNIPSNWAATDSQLEANPIADLARTPEINNLDGRSLGVAEENVLGLEIAVDDVQARQR